MKFEQKHINTILLSFTLSIILSILPNKSNFPKILMIPIIVSLLVKYILGDWDDGYTWSHIDLYYWISIISTSYITVFVYNIKNNEY